MSNVLFCVAHCDDEILICGGTLAKHVADGDKVRGLILSPGVGSRDGSRDGIPARIAMCSAASDVIGYDVAILDWPDQRFDTRPQLELNQVIENMVDEVKPDIVYTHWDQDNNLDHRLVSQACQVACRSIGLIWMCEPIGCWSHKEWDIEFARKKFGGAKKVDISNYIDFKRRALDCYKDELGEVAFPAAERFIVIGFLTQEQRARQVKELNEYREQRKKEVSR